MARFDTTGLDKLISEMQKMGETSGAIAEAMVTAASVEIRDCWRESADKHGHVDTGAMIESIGFPQPVKRMGDILYRDIYPQGKDKRGRKKAVRNAEKAFILNYGTSTIKPSHWVDEAEDAAGDRVQSRLESIWDQYLESGGTVPPIVDTGGLTHRK